MHPGLSGGRIKKKSNSLPGHLRTTAPLIREKGPPPLGFCAASPHCQHSHCGRPDTGRGKRQEFPLPLNIGNPLSYSLNQNSKAPSRTVSVPVSTSVYWITPNPGWDTGEKKGKKKNHRKCNIVPVVLCILVFSPILLMFPSPYILSWCYKQCSVEKQSTVLALCYLEPTLHLFWGVWCFFFFLVVLGLHCCA